MREDDGIGKQFIVPADQVEYLVKAGLTVSANTFWLQFLSAYTPRSILAWLDGFETVISYSDGEGAKAGLGIAVWSSRCPSGPLAAFCEIPEKIRDLWSSQDTDERNDI